MKTLTLSFLLLFLLPRTLADCNCSPDVSSARDHNNKSSAQHLKIAAIFSILVGGFIGVCIPILGKWVPHLRPESDIFFIVKAFAAGVILATGFVHILPDAYESLTSPCLSEKPWQDFPFTGFVAMVAAIGTLMIDSFAMGYYNRAHFKKVEANRGGDEEVGGDGDGDGHGHGHGEHVHVHTHATHGHAHGSGEADGGAKELIRHRVVSQV